MSSWEERMAERARRRAADTKAALDADDTITDDLPALPGDRWREHELDESGYPVGVAGDWPDDTWPDHTACRRCYEHDEAGRVHEEPFRGWWGGVGFRPIQICDYAWHYDQTAGRSLTAGCDCFCHVIEPVPVAIAATTVGEAPDPTPRRGQFIARPERVDAPQSSTHNPTTKADTP